MSSSDLDNSSSSSHRPSSSPDAVRHVVVAGFGPVGRVVTECLGRAGVEVTLIEMNEKTIGTQTRQGRRAVYGDVSEPKVLCEAGVEQCDALILTIPDEEAALRACAEARRLAPDLYISVRVHHPSGAMRAKAAGADHATIEELVTAYAMEAAVEEHLGVGKAQ